MAVPTNKTMATLTEDDAAAILRAISQKATDMDSALSLFESLLPRDFFEEVDEDEDVGEDEELGFGASLLVALYNVFLDMKVLYEGYAESINDYLHKNSAYGFLAYEISRRGYQKKAFTYEEAKRCLDMSDASNREYRAIFKTEDEYLAACKKNFDEVQQEFKEENDRYVEKQVREELAKSEGYREKLYEHIAIPRGFGARGDERLGVWELITEGDYDYLFSFDSAALRARGDLYAAADLPEKHTGEEENADLAAFVEAFAPQTKSAATDRVIEGALSLLPFLYERSRALEGLHRDPSRAHRVYEDALAKRPSTKKNHKTVTANPFADIEAIAKREQSTVDALQDKLDGAAKRKATYGALQPKMTVAFWVMVALSVLGMALGFVYTYQTGLALPAPAYAVGLLVTVVAFILGAAFVDFDWTWTERDPKIGILIAVGVLAVFWFGLLVSPETLIESLPANR